MTTYRDLNTAQRRALDRFARAHDFESPASNWPELGSEAIRALIGHGLLESRGRNEQDEEIYRVTDSGTRVHDEMWQAGKVPSHPNSDPFDPQTLD
ncbi:hypothetical protein [Terrihabitans sp. B22-R8]|uniref:hypothetical protein n=1 Tax=Terrihabitans sp. B22-R8 TaxID=3425128 RepID=UPI00403C98E5